MYRDVVASPLERFWGGSGHAAEGSGSMEGWGGWGAQGSTVATALAHITGNQETTVVHTLGLQSLVSDQWTERENKQKRKNTKWRQGESQTNTEGMKE